MGVHDRPVSPKRVLGRPRSRSRTRGPASEYADTPGWILLVQSGRGAIDELGLLAAVWVAIRSIRRRLLGP